MMSWKEANACCSWDGVTCDMVTGHVIALDLSCSWLYGNIPSNSSLFRLRHLQSLNLAFNDIFSQIPSGFSRLSSLTVLNLSHLNFAPGPIPSEISHLSKLVLLDLSSLSLTIETPVLEGLIQNLTQLRELTLDSVNMATVTPNSLLNISSSLTSLSLHDCGMEGKLPVHIFNLPNLQLLDLGSNIQLTGNLSMVNWSSPLKHLDISFTSLSGALPNSIGNLKSLRYLNLEYCMLFGSIPASLANLTQLTHLDLSFNIFNGTILASLANLTQLTYLDISWNNFTGTIPASLANLSQLTILDLSFNDFNGTIPVSLANLTKLAHLDLSHNRFIGTILASLANLTQLTHLDLSYNNFIGTIPTSLVNLRQLTHFDISWNIFNGKITDFFVNPKQISFLCLGGNQLVGAIPSSLFALPLLEFIDLSYMQLTGHIEDFTSDSLKNIDLGGNRLHGSIPSSIFELVNLTTLILSSNNLSGNIELYMFAKLKKLELLHLSYNRLSVRTTSKANSSFPQLLELSLSACNISEFPDILRGSNKLDTLYLSENRIKGQFPNWMLDFGRDTLHRLNLSNNFLTSIEQIPWKNLAYLDLRSNLLQGPIPNLPPYLEYLFLPNNNLTGTIQHVICDLSSIRMLDLSDNFLTGNIPKCMGNIIRNLEVLDLQKNRFYGTIPEICPNDNALQTLNLNNNGLEGQVPGSLLNCTVLEVLDIGNNNINDTFPYWLGNLPNLRVLVLRSNKFHGSVWHVSEASNRSFLELRILDLSSNYFSGSLRVRYFENMKAMVNVDKIEKNLEYMGDSYYQDSVTVTIKGSELLLEKVITIFTTIDLSNNNFHGEIPDIIGNFHALILLNLSHNNLTSYIPSSLGNLAALESLDLSSNKLVGNIPWQLSRLNFLEVLNLSENQLWGPIPSGNQFATFPTTSYSGNLGLCGFPLPNKCGENDTQPPPSKSEEDAKFWDGFGWKSVLAGYGCGVAFGVSIGYIVFFTGKPRWVVDEVAYWSVQLRGMDMLARRGRRLNKKREGR